MKIKYADESAFEFIVKNDIHLSRDLIENKLINSEIILTTDDSENIIGWLRYGYFWDNTPFMNMLFVNEEFRNSGIGKGMVGFFESQMKSKGYSIVLTSTLSNENAQHFYRKLGYIDSGSLLLEGEALEIIFSKKI